MQKRLMFVTGAGLGYVLGSRAGRGRYEQIRTQADQVWNDPRVQEKVGLAQAKVQEQMPVVQEKAQGLAATAQAKASEAASTAQTKAAGAASTVKAKVSGDHSGNQIGVESGSDVEPHEVKYESGR